MNRIYKKYCQLSNVTRNSLIVGLSIICFIFSVVSVMGYSLDDLKGYKICTFMLNDNGRVTFIWKCFILIAAYLVICLLVRCSINMIWSDSIKLDFGKNTVILKRGNIFEEPGYRVIPCDSQFNINIDDVIISEKTLHGQLVLNHGDRKGIKRAIKNGAKLLPRIKKGKNGLYKFPLGTIIRYKNTKERTVYLLLAMTALNNKHEAHTNMAEFEQTLVKMWNEINRVYSSNDIVLPILGTGITRFDDGSKDTNALLSAMLKTLKTSCTIFNSKITIVIYEENSISLYEYKDIFYKI